MNKQDKINEINAKYNQDYQLGKNGRIFTLFMGKKIWQSFNEVVSSYRATERERNSEVNAKRVFDYIESVGGECTYKSMFGSRYYDYKGFKVRVSNHDWTSENHVNPDVNLCSYEDGGYVEMIKKLRSL